MHIARTNTILYCARWTDTVAFYRDVIGLDASFENDWFVEFELADGAHVSVADASRTTIEPSGGTGITLSWKVDDLTETCSELATHGIGVSETTRRWGAVAAFLHDPEGNRIELWSTDVDA